MPGPIPPIKTIASQHTWEPLNKSAILYDTTKLASLPESLYEIEGYRERLSDEEGWVVEHVYICNWSDLADVMQWLRGYSYVTAEGALSRVPPAQDPYRPWLYCTKAEMIEAVGVPLQDPMMPAVPATVWAGKEPVGGKDAFVDGRAKLRATFRGLPYVVRNDFQQSEGELVEEQGELGRYVERQPRYAIQGLPLANIAKQGQLYFVGTNTLVPEAGILLMPIVTWHYTWREVPFYPDLAIQNVVGRINKAPFDGLVGLPFFPSWSLLCQAPEIKTKRNAAGQIVFDITWILDYRPQGWNYFPTAKGTFQLATFGGGLPAADSSNLVFKEADFSKLFAVGLPTAWV